MYHVPVAFQCIYGCIDERDGNGYGEERKDWRLPGILYADDLALCSESKEDLKVIVRHFVLVCRKKSGS